MATSKEKNMTAAMESHVTATTVVGSVLLGLALLLLNFDALMSVTRTLRLMFGGV